MYGHSLEAAGVYRHMYGHMFRNMHRHVYGHGLEAAGLGKRIKSGDKGMRLSIHVPFGRKQANLSVHASEEY